MLANIHRNVLGTVSFEAQFKGQRKPQEWIVYPIPEEVPDRIKVQSDTRIGYIMLDTGTVWMSKPHPAGAYNHHLGEVVIIDKVNAEDMFMLKAHITASASAKAGTNGMVYTDNRGAANVFGVRL